MERHGFVTFWLWASIISSIILLFGYVTAPEFFAALSYNNNKTLLFIASLALICWGISAILILNWKNGFLLYIVGSIIYTFVNIGFGMNILLNIVLSISGILIFFGILHLKKNGVSTWDYLTGNYTNKFGNTANKKCRQCEYVYSGSSSCPKCGSSFYEEISEVNNIKALGQTNNQNKNIGDTWVCKKCGERNPLTASTCKGCGEYK